MDKLNKHLPLHDEVHHQFLYFLALGCCKLLGAPSVEKLITDVEHGYIELQGDAYRTAAFDALKEERILAKFGDLIKQHADNPHAPYWADGLRQLIGGCPVHVQEEAEFSRIAARIV